jgi:hypothetical protein
MYLCQSSFTPAISFVLVNVKAALLFGPVRSALGRIAFSQS